MSDNDDHSEVAGRTIVLGVSGGIAAYKSVELLRALTDSGAIVLPIMTKAAHRFIGATTLSALASEPVQDSLFSESEAIPHTRLGQRADAIVVAPATATVIAKYAAGIGDDLLTATLLATRAPVVLAPAMHTEMWEHPATHENIERLRSRGVHIVEPESGRLAGGDVGTGRLASTERIVNQLREILQHSGELSGVRVLVTAGGTREPIDSVRVIANRSSGKMGFAMARVAAERGASVRLISTVDRPTPPGVEIEQVETAEEMRAAVTKHAAETDVVIMAAAVADFRPVGVADRKLKKQEGIPTIALEPTADILAELGAQPADSRPVLVGFAAETDNVVEHSRSKVKQKQLDWLVANDVSQPDAGFQVDTNRVLLLDSDGEIEPIPLQSKLDAARAIWSRIGPTLNQRSEIE